MRGAKAYRGLQDVQLVALVAERDPGALVALFDRYGAAAWSLAWRLLADQARAQDVVREVFVALWRDGSRPDLSQAIDKRLLVMIYRRALEVARSGERRRHPGRREPPPGSGDASGEQAGSARRVAWEGSTGPPGAHAGSSQGARRAGRGQVAGPLAQRRARAQAALAALPPAQREALALACFDGYTQREVASLVGVPPETAAARMADGMRGLREALAGEPDRERLQ